MINRKFVKYIILLLVICSVLFVCGCTGAQAVPGSSNSNTYNAPPPTPKVDITAMNWYIDYTGTSGYFGPSSQSYNGGYVYNAGDQFTYTMTFQSTALMFSHPINAITIQTPGFSIISINPQLPTQKIPSGGSISITITIQTPSYAYTGPLDLRMSTS